MVPVSTFLRIEAIFAGLVGSTGCTWSLTSEVSRLYTELGVNSSSLLPPEAYGTVCEIAEAKVSACSLDSRRLFRPNSYKDISSLIEYTSDEYDARPKCKQTLTVQLAGSEQNFLKSIMDVWTSYGIAMQEGREFFLDDSDWMYGKWTDYFEPLPEASCRPPPPKYRLPCPHNTAHLVISSSARRWSLADNFINTNALTEHGKLFDTLDYAKETLEAAQEGYNDLWKLREDIVNGTVSAANGLDSQKLSFADRQLMYRFYSAFQGGRKDKITSLKSNSADKCVGVHIYWDESVLNKRNGWNNHRWQQYSRALRTLKLDPNTKLSVAIEKTRKKSLSTFELYPTYDKFENQYSLSLRRDMAIMAIHDLNALSTCHHAICDVRNVICRMLLVMHSSRESFSSEIVSDNSWVNIEGEVIWAGVAWKF
ncbi:hypothetical protein V1511DRAFT_508637 [Dipodascopsis uninucleata]